MKIREHLRHRQNKNRNGQCGGNPESPPHIEILRVGRVVQRKSLRLQRHSANRINAGSDLHDLRIHRTSVFHAFRRFAHRFGRGVRIQKSFGRLAEFIQTADGAEIISRVFVLIISRLRLRFNEHFANRVNVRFKIFFGDFASAELDDLRLLFRGFFPNVLNRFL